MDYTTNYTITTNRLVSRLLPFFLRGRKVYSFMCAILYPLIKSHSNFLTWAQSTLVKVKLPFQTAALEWRLDKLLDEEYNYTSGGCKVDRFAHQNYGPWIYPTGSSVTPIYVYNISENVTTNTTNYMYYRKEVAADTDYHFNLLIPHFSSDDEIQKNFCNEVRDIVSTYSIIKQFDIIILNA